MQRRDFLKYSVALGVASALPLWSRAVFAAERPTLPIPDLLTTDARNRIQLTIGAGQSTFGGKTATMSGAVLVFGVLITWLCALLSINKYLRMKASTLY